VILELFHVGGVNHLKLKRLFSASLTILSKQSHSRRSFPIKDICRDFKPILPFIMSSQSSSQLRGALIVVEGLDRAGKTSQCQLLLDALKKQGHQVQYIKFPGDMLPHYMLPLWWLIHACKDRDTPTGKMINEYLQGQAQQDDHSIHLLFSANRWEAARRIKSNLSQGITLIIDRYSYSGAVYSAAKDNPDLSLEWAWQPEVGLPRPDLLLFLSVSSEVAAKRGGYGEERYETDSMQSKVKHLFESVLNMNHGHEIRIIDAGCSMEQVAQNVLSITLDVLSERKAFNTLEKLRSWHELQNPSDTDS
jgi:dTMP kinase